MPRNQLARHHLAYWRAGDVAKLVCRIAGVNHLEIFLLWVTHCMKQAADRLTTFDGAHTLAGAPFYYVEGQR